MFFEDIKTITVNGISFNMILVEGDKFMMDVQTPFYGTIHHRYKREVELDDFYMAEIPVTQELYAAVMQQGYGNTKSYNMMPESFNYLHPNHGLPSPDYRIFGIESNEEYHKRRERELTEKRERETKEYNRIRELTPTLPVNCISWHESIEFINKLNSLTGLYFALPSFEQWYFAASGGIESKGYKFAGSDDANAVGHFHKLSKKEFRPGVYVMTGEHDKSKVRKPAIKWYEKPKQYQPNELGLFDMSGLVYEWLDEAGYVIGGSFHSDPDQVCKIYGYGYTRFNNINSCINERGIFAISNSSYEDSIFCGNLFGLRLVLLDRPKNYQIPTFPTKEFKIELTEAEQYIIGNIFKLPNLGVLRRVFGEKYEKCNKWGSMHTYYDFRGNIYDIFICPQNLKAFEANCFSNYHSRRKFINHCIDEFKKLLKILCDGGYNLLIHDNIGLDLGELGIHPLSIPDLSNRDFKNKNARLWAEILKETHFFTNNQDIIKLVKLTLPTTRLNYTPKSIESLKVVPNIILIDVKFIHDVQKETSVNIDWLSKSYQLSGSNNINRITFNCFCNFNLDENDTEKNYGCDYFRTEGIVRFMSKQLLKNGGRVNNQDFNTTELINELFCVRSLGGDYIHNFPESKGTYIIQDESFFILPEIVFDEWRESLQEIKR